MKLTAGQPAPPFALPATGGQTVSLDSFRGRKIVLYFYPKNDTNSCTREAQDFQRLKQDFAFSGTDVIGISPDSLKSHDKFREKYALDFVLASDEAKTVLEAYGVWVEKSMHGRKFMGVERTTILVDRDGVIARIWARVKVPGHVEEVLEAAAAL